ncbi:MAG: HAD-IA family hydrolase [Dehalococcoidia bacterium]|nr:HAD-IA family hydrolase [Dehalococcoidia bacterium]
MRAGRLLRERGVTLLSLDLDDTLLDTDAAAEYRVQAAAQRASEVLGGLDVAMVDQALRAAMAANPVTQGRMAQFLQTLGVEPQSNEATAIRAQYNAVMLDALVLMEGAEVTLSRLREHYRLAIVTNGPTEMQWPKLRKFALEGLVDHVVVSGDLGVHKPDPAIFRHLLTEAGVEADSAAHVGDSIHSDIAGALAAGMTAIWMPPHLRAHDEVGEHQPHAVIETLADLLDSVSDEG